MKEHIYEQKIDFSDRPLRSSLSQSFPAYSKIHKKFWEKARLNNIIPELDLLIKKEIAKTNTIFKNTYIVAWKSFSA